MELAQDEGLKVQERPIPLEELSSLREVAACGTAVVVTPVNRIVVKDQVGEGGKGESVAVHHLRQSQLAHVLPHRS